MAHKIIEAFLDGRKITRDCWDKNQYLVKEEKDTIAIYNGFGLNINEQAVTLLNHPEYFKLYQEPKKAWIENEVFLVDCTGIFISTKQRGAIELAREFLKRIDLFYTVPDNVKTYTLDYLKERLIDLVGKENLK